MRMDAIQSGARLSFRRLKHLRRLRLSLAALRLPHCAGLATYREETLLALVFGGPGLLDQLLGTVTKVFEALFSLRQQIQKWAKKYPAEYKPKNEKGNNQRTESSPIRWDVHVTASPF